MKTAKLIFLSTLFIFSSQRAGLAASFDSGSTGADGALNIISNTTLSLPANGMFNFTTINVASGSTLKFLRNDLNTPVHLLATSNVTIAGIIDISGLPGSTSVAGQGGPGGFDGGNPAAGIDPPGDGYGPGAGTGGDPNFQSASRARGGTYGTTTIYSSSNRYGNLYIQPLIGGSGGGGTSTNTSGILPYIEGGGGGGGAILIASTTQITVSGSILAKGGAGTGSINFINGGSGGAIRLVAPKVSGSGILNAGATPMGGVNGGPIAQAGDGRIRIDTPDTSGVGFNSTGRSSVGANMTVFPSPIPRLDVIGVASNSIPVGTNGTVFITLPLNTPTNQPVTVQAMDFSGQVSFEVVVTPMNGASQRFPGLVDLTNTNRVVAIVNVIIPADIPCRINAWTR
jgi:hypothetical protein